jgi:ubiquinone/menaquinone biosynthesis C-methylase UbiE
LLIWTLTRVNALPKINICRQTAQSSEERVPDLRRPSEKPSLEPSQEKIVAESPSDLSKAWTGYYDRLADHFIELIGQRRFQVILEAGCGKGQLTIPLLRRLPPKVQLIAIDSSKGPYKGWLTELGRKLRTAGLERRVQAIKSDARRIRGIEDATIDIVVSNELLCDLPDDFQLEKALSEFYRILQPGGLMIHGEWSSAPAAEPQAFLVKHWPSWTPDQLFSIMRKRGFRKFQVTYFGTTIRFGYANAVEELRTWGASETFLRRNNEMLRREGIELPYEHMIRCEK